MYISEHVLKEFEIQFKEEFSLFLFLFSFYSLPTKLLHLAHITMIDHIQKVYNPTITNSRSS